MIAHSGVLPRVLGGLLVVAGLAYLINSFALLLAPDVARLLFPAVLVPAFVGELLLALWLTAGKHRVVAPRAGPTSGASSLPASS